MIGAIQPLVEVKGTGHFNPPPEPEVDRTYRGTYRVLCRDCGDVTHEESVFTVEDATIQQAGLYRQRHLARHLSALANEIQDAAR